MTSFIDLFPRQVSCLRAAMLPVSADEAWKVIGDIGSEVMSAGMVERVETSGTGTGALRTYHLPGGAVIKERIEEHDPQERFYVYRILDAGPMPMVRYLGLAQVTPAGAHSSIVSWSAMADSLDGDVNGLRAMLDANLAHAVGALAEHFRGSAGQ
jgi:hypothetical protein